MNRKLNAALLLLLTATVVNGQDLISNFGEERAGTTSLQFLKIGVGARAEGMAQAFVGVADDATALYWNPAGLGMMEGSSVYFTHLDWPADIDYDYIGVTHRLNQRLAFGLAYAQLATDAMAVTTETHPDGDGRTFYFTDQLLQLTASARMTNQFSAGLSVKYVREDIAEVKMSSYLVDLGTFYQTGWRDLTVAVALVNMGGVISPNESYTPPYENNDNDKEYDEFSPPTVFRLGGAMTVWRDTANIHQLLLATQVNHPVDARESYSFGAEYGFMKWAFLRAGWKLNSDEESWSLGAGMKYGLGKMNLRLDFSYSDFGLLDNSRRMSAEFDWINKGAGR